ncbi:unnamed protein product [Rhizophagus irregularis]|nr:unnamed protein product [Rhizophagus irregularis]
MENFVRELQLLHQVNVHPNINRFLGVTKDPVHDDYIIILQYANQGNLREYLEKSFLSLHWKDKAQMALDITCGLKYLHSRQIIHRDLHAKNILVNNGMPAYIDPQCYINNNYKRNKKSDIYSLEVASHDSNIENLDLPNDLNVSKEVNWIEGSKLQFNSKVQFKNMINDFNSVNTINSISSMKNPYI